MELTDGAEGKKAFDLLVGLEIFSFLRVTVRANVPLYVFPTLVATTAFDPAKVAPKIVAG